MLRRYTLAADGRTPVPADDVLAWARWFERADCQVARTAVDTAVVTTDFLGVDHQQIPGGEPLLFETTVFGGRHAGYQRRYSTWSEAEAGHRAAVALVAGGDGAAG